MSNLNLPHLDCKSDEAKRSSVSWIEICRMSQKAVAFQTPMTSRRQLLVSMMAGSAAFSCGSVLAADPNKAAGSAATSGPAEIVAAEPGGVVRVRLEMEISGNVNIARNPLVSRDLDLQLPIASDAVFDYEERTRLRGDKSSITERFYHVAGCDARLNKTIQQKRLRQSVRSTMVERRLLPETIYSDDDFLTVDEVDLLRVPVSSVAVDMLLPPEKISPTVKMGTNYIPSLDSVASVFNLTSVQTSDLSIKVVSIDDSRVKFELGGDVLGSVDGVPTTLRTIGKMTFDRESRMVSWLAVAIHETRQIGAGEPGFDLRATVKMVRQPFGKPIGLVATPSSRLNSNELPEGRLMTQIQSETIGVSAMMNRHWQSMSDVAGAAVWRMTDNDRSIAQCDLRPLPPLKPGKTWTLKQFVSDVGKTLGSQMEQIVDQSERISETGLRVLSVTASGTAGTVPVRWTLLHFDNQNLVAQQKAAAEKNVDKVVGIVDAENPDQEPDQENANSDDQIVKSEGIPARRLLATFTMQSDSVDRFAGSELQLAGTLRFTARQFDAVSTPESSVPSGMPDDSPKRISSRSKQTQKKSSGQVQSLSDLR